MKITWFIFLLFFLIGCLPAPSGVGSKDSKSEVVEPISATQQALKNSAPIAKAIIAEKDILIQTNNLSSATKNALESAVVDIDKKSAAKSEEEYLASKAIVDCTKSNTVINCAK